jgi:hypothetical protein
MAGERDFQADLDARIAALRAYDGDPEIKAMCEGAAEMLASAKGKSPIPSEEQLDAMTEEQERQWAGLPPLPSPPPDRRLALTRLVRRLRLVPLAASRRRGTSRAPRSQARSRPQKARAPDPPSSSRPAVGRASRGRSAVVRAGTRRR